VRRLDLAHPTVVATVLDICEAVDAFLASPKRIVGYDSPPEWTPGFSVHERVMKYPLEIGGELRGPN
jgi:hypothetical protein